MEAQWEFKRRLVDYYDALSRGYDELYGEEQARKHSAVLAAVGGARAGVVLDLGCGTGLLTERLPSAGAGYVVAADISAGMAARAKARLPPAADLVICDCELLPLRGEAFDLVLAVTVLQNAYDMRRALSEAARVAREGGLVVATVPSRGGLPEALVACARTEGSLALLRVAAAGSDTMLVAAKLAAPRRRAARARRPLLRRCAHSLSPTPTQ